MARWVYLLTVFAGLAAWAGAQNPAPALSPEDKLRLLQANGALIDELVRDGVALSAAATPEDQAARCRDTSLALANEIRRASAAADAERVIELTNLFRDVMRDGVVPTITDGLNAVPPQSPAAKKLRVVRDLAAGDVVTVKTAAGNLADNPRVKESLKQLDELTESLK